MKSESFHPRSSIPPIVHIVLSQATQRRAEGGITGAIFDKQIRRIAHEELTPKGLKLLVREMPGGCTRFIIKEQATGAVRDLLNFNANGTLEPASGALVDSEVAPA